MQLHPIHFVTRHIRYYANARANLGNPYVNDAAGSSIRVAKPNSPWLKPGHSNAPLTFVTPNVLPNAPPSFLQRRMLFPRAEPHRGW
jgi:hypothetical protein